MKIVASLTYKPTSDLHFQCNIDGIDVKFKIPANCSTFISGGYYETDATYSTTTIASKSSHTVNNLRFNSSFHTGITYNGSSWGWQDLSQKYSLETLSYTYSGGLQTPVTITPRYNINIHRLSGVNGFSISISSQGSVSPLINMTGTEGTSTIYSSGGGLQSQEWILKVKNEINNKIYYISPRIMSGLKDGNKIVIDVTNPYNYTTFYPWDNSVIPDATGTTGGYQEFKDFNVMKLQFLDIVFSNTTANSNSKNWAVY